MVCLEEYKCILCLGSAVFGILGLLYFAWLKAFTTKHPIIIRYDEEQYFLSSTSGKKEKFASINDEPTIELSVIVPAYNEESRLPIMLDESLAFLEKQSYQYEMIIVSDGSTDDTVDVAQNYAKKYTSEKIRVLRLIKNRGKGGAVRLGIQSARGKYLLFADADGASKFSDFEKLHKEMMAIGSDWKEKAIVIGSRAHLQDEAVATRTIFRTILMHGFHLLVWLFTVRDVRDTQCGFKLFTRSTAKILFSMMHIERWAFDVELLFIAQYLKWPIKEVPISWMEIDGSKITPIWSWLQMGRDLILIWFRYTVGAWSLKIPNVT